MNDTEMPGELRCRPILGYKEYVCLSPAAAPYRCQGEVPGIKGPFSLFKKRALFDQAIRHLGTRGTLAQQC